MVTLTSRSSCRNAQEDAHEHLTLSIIVLGLMSLARLAFNWHGWVSTTIELFLLIRSLVNAKIIRDERSNTEAQAHTQALLPDATPDAHDARVEAAEDGRCAASAATNTKALTAGGWV